MSTPMSGNVAVAVMSAPSRNVSYNKPDEPAFLKAFKAKAGYKEPEVTIESKRALPQDKPREEGDDRVREDELPTVVALQEGDISETEYRNFLEKVEELRKERAAKGDIKTDQEPADGKITFKKPIKRSGSDTGSGHILSASSSKRPKQTDSSPTTKSSSSSKGVKNATLLSFEDDDDDDQ